VASVIGAGVFVQFLGCAFMWDHFIRVTLAVNRQWLGSKICTGFCYEELGAFQWAPPFTQLWGHWWLLKHVPREHTWKEAQLDAPWRRYTDLEITQAEPYNRARVDWWWKDYPRDHLGLGVGLMTTMLLGLGASGFVFARQERARLRAEVALP
jgi:hypothetical protein